jgi:hypothetical protein
MRPRVVLCALVAALPLLAAMPLTSAVVAFTGTAEPRSVSVETDGSVTVTLLAYDPANTGTSDATITVATSPAHGALQAIGGTTCADGLAGCWRTMTYTPEAGYSGPDSFDYTVDNGVTSPSTATVTISVGGSTTAPVGTTEATQAFIEDRADWGGVNLLANDTDGDGDSLTAVLGDPPAHGTVQLYPDGFFRYQGDPDYSAFANQAGIPTDSFTYRASDGTHLSDPITVALFIFEVNDPPRFTSAANVTVAEDSGARTIAGWASAIRSGSIYEEPLETVTFTVTADDPALFSVQPAIAAQPDPGPSATSSLTFTPKPDAFGSTTVTVVARDDGGIGAGDGDDTADPVTFTLTITNVQDPPVASDHEATTDEDTFVDIPVTTGATDPDGDTLAVTAATDGTHGTTTIQPGNQLVRYTPATDWNGVDTFTFSVSDGHGGTDTRSVSVTVDAVDDPPSFTVGPDVIVSEDAGPQTLTGWATHISVGGPDESPAQSPTFSIVGDDNAALFLTPPAVASDGTLTFRAKANTNGVANVTLRLSDGVAHVDQGFTITVNPVNDPPVAANDTGVTVPALSAAKAIPVLANDVTDAGETLSIVSVTQGTKGKVAITGGGTGLTYTPTGCNVGSDTFTYTVSDGSGGTDPATVLLTITRDTVKPVALAPGGTFVTGTAIGTSTVPVRESWCATDPGTGVARYQLQQSTDSAAYGTVALSSAKATSITRNLTAGHRYQFRVRGVDGDGTVGAFAAGPRSLIGRTQESATTITYTGSWTSVASSTASGGRVRYTGAANASATYTFSGRAVGVVSPTSASRGSFKVYVDGVLVSTVSEKTSSTIVRRVVFARTLTPGTHTLKLVAVGNGRIDLDAIVTLS